MSQSLLGGFSGRIGEPEGAWKLLNKAEVQREIQDYVQAVVQQEIVNISVGTIDSARVNAAGTIISRSGVSSVTRQAEGWYRVKLSSAASSDSAIRAVVTPATTAGNGGDGVTPLKAFNNFEIEDTDDDTSNFVVNPSDANELLLLGPTIDGLYRHDITVGTFPGTAATVDAGTYAVESTPQTGCISYQGGYAWFSGKADTYGVRAINLTTEAVTDFSGTPGPGVPATGQIMLFADDNSGTPRIWIKEGSDLRRYTPNFGGTPSIGTADHNYASVTDVSINALPFVQDNDGYLWGCDGTRLIQFDKASGDSWFHIADSAIAAPASGSPFGFTRNFYDASQNRLIVAADGHSTGSYDGKRMLWEYKNWTNELASSGTWRLLGIIGTGQFSFWYDSASGVMFVADTSTEVVRRYVGDPLTLLDEVSVNDTSPDNADIDYDLVSSYACYYDSDGYGYVQGKKGAAYYIIRIDYQGDPIGIGTGGAVVSSVLVPQYQVIDADTVDVYLYRTLSPPQRADGEFSVHIAKD